VLLKRRKSDASGPPEPLPERWKMFGDEDPEIVLGGHSNAACYVIARDSGLGPRSVRAGIAYPADFGAVDDSYWDFLATAGAGRAIAVVWDGNQHNGAFLVQPDPPFRVYGCSSVATPEQEAGRWIPRAMVSSYWEPSFADLGRTLDRLVERSRVLVVGTPPPNPEAHVRERFEGKLDWDPWIRDIASTREQASSELPVSPESLRLALWSIIQEGMREQARRAGCTFVAVPDSVRDDAGLLAAPYSAGDLTHANAEYAGVMWAEIEAALSSGEER
jgi:hypothetical protein